MIPAIKVSAQSDSERGKIMKIELATENSCGRSGGYIAASPHDKPTNPNMECNYQIGLIISVGHFF